MAVLAFLVAVVAIVRARARRTPRALPALVDADALEDYLRDLQTRLDGIAHAVEALDGRAASLEGNTRRAVQHVGMVRFNPFEDTGSNQSFALAVLDGDANGVILSSLHSRNQTRLYVKEVVAGRSEAPFSAEESEAMKRAGLGAS